MTGGGEAAGGSSEAARPGRPMKVLAIAPQPFFTPRGTPLSVYYRTLVTAEMGHAVDLLTYGQGADVDLPGVRIVRIPAFGWLGPVKVGPSPLKAFLDLFVVAWAIGMMIRHRYDVVHAHEESVFFCRFLKPIFRFRLVYDMHSILSQQLVNFAFTRSRLLIGAFRRLEDGCLAKADGVITISPALAAYAEPRVRSPEAHVLIENSLFDPVRLRGDRAPGASSFGGRGAEEPHTRAAGPQDQEVTDAGSLAVAEKPPAKRVAADEDAPDWLSLLGGPRPLVLYAGTFESYQGIPLLLRAFAAARAEAPDAFLLLLGGRPEQVEAARAQAEGLGIADHCRFAGQVSRDLAQRATRQATVLTSPRTVGDNTPLKIYEQLASGVPLVATRIGSHTQVLGDEHCVLVDPDAEAFGAGLVTALRGGPDVERRVVAARALYDDRYSPAVYRKKMRRLFDLVSR